MENGISFYNKHLKNIFESGELIEAATISKMETTASDRKSYQTKFHNLDAIIAGSFALAFPVAPSPARTLRT